jgi:predicted DNA binding CopG/RHH family protein
MEQAKIARHEVNEEHRPRERGRPAKEEKKLSRSINLKLTEDDYKAIVQKAADIGMKPTQYARKMVLNGRIKSRYTKEELDLRRKIVGMANNLNQIARKANAGGFDNVGWALIDLWEDLRKLLDDR